jgi:hypothetical protein
MIPWTLLHGASSVGLLLRIEMPAWGPNSVEALSLLVYFVNISQSLEVMYMPLKGFGLNFTSYLRMYDIFG